MDPIRTESVLEALDVEAVDVARGRSNGEQKKKVGMGDEPYRTEEVSADYCVNASDGVNNLKAAKKSLQARAIEDR